MHSRIYQITTKPVPQDEYLSASDFCEHWFVGEIADYVSNDTNRDYEVESLKECLVGNKMAEFHSDGSFSFLPGGKELYFKGCYNRLLDAAQKMAAISLEDFASDGECGMLVYTIKSSYCDRFGWYVSSDEFDTMPFDSFLRCVEPGKRYYIGSVLNYHF